MKRNLKSLMGMMAVAAAGSALLGGCVVAARQPVGYTTYGYQTVAQPNTVYYQGGYYGGTYYRPGYYYRHAPFVTTYAQPARTVVYQQPVYQQPAYGVGVAAGVPGVSGSVRVGGY